MRVTLETPLAVLRQQYLYIEVAEERLVGDIVIPIAEVTVDDKPVYRLQLEVRFVLPTHGGSFALRTDSHAEREHIRQFGQPCVNLTRHCGRQQRIGRVERCSTRVGHILRREEPSENEQVNNLTH